MTARPDLDAGALMVDAALSYAHRGWLVLPIHSVDTGRCTCGRADCASPAKHPLTRRGLKDATTDLQVIQRWWQRWPRANVAVRTGQESGLLVLDFDPRNGGDESLAALVHEHGALPLSVQSHTGGGGEHHFFSAPAHGGGLRSTLAMGIDVKADGGYVLLPPSSHISGGAYRWREGHAPHEIELARPADWLLEMLARRTAPVAAPPRSTAPQCSGSDDLLSAGQRYVSAAEPAEEGARNSAAFRLAGHLAAFETASGERLARAQTLELVREWNARNRAPLSAGELEQTVDSAMRNGQPRAAHEVTGRAATPRSPELAPASADAARLVDPHDRPAPRPLPAALPAVAPFHPDLLPESLRPWSQDIAERVQCPPDFPAVALMITLATVVGRKIGIRPKRRDDWLVVPNLWGAVCGPPGVMKTPAIQEPLRILNRMEIQAKAAHDAAVSEFAARQLVDEQRRQVARGDVRAALKSGEDALAIAMTGLGECARPPARRRYLLNDATIEKLGEILRENPNGVLLFRDELVGFLRSLD